MGMPYLNRIDRKTKKQLKILKDTGATAYYIKKGIFENKNKEERYSRVPRLSDTRYSAKWRYASSNAR